MLVRSPNTNVVVKCLPKAVGSKFDYVSICRLMQACADKEEAMSCEGLLPTGTIHTSISLIQFQNKTCIPSGIIIISSQPCYIVTRG